MQILHAFKLHLNAQEAEKKKIMETTKLLLQTKLKYTFKHTKLYYTQAKKQTKNSIKCTHIGSNFKAVLSKR